LLDRIRKLNDAEFPAHAKYVLYCAERNRRARGNHALTFAVELANERGLPVLFYEELTSDYPHASDRLHTFVLEGVPDTSARLAELGIGYAFHLQPRQRQTAPGILGNAAAVITDDYPWVPARHFAIPHYAVDSSCVVPMHRFDKREYAAYTIRPRIHKFLPDYLQPFPAVRVAHAWRGPAPDFHTHVVIAHIPALVASCNIDHSIAPSPCFRGGSAEAERRLRDFLQTGLRRYASEKNEPSAPATSGLSPYLHFGHISSLDVATSAREHAARNKLIAGEFLEELIVRRELAFNFVRFTPDCRSLEALPSWARETLAKHDADSRPALYTREQLEAAVTHDPLWNAAQCQLLRQATIHGYYRMYWGKKIMEWSRTHSEALATMIYLNDRYALDGCDPNSYANILWCFGLHDRPWGERPVFGTVRYMSLAGMRRKTNVDEYVASYPLQSRYSAALGALERIH